MVHCGWWHLRYYWKCRSRHSKQYRDRHWWSGFEWYREFAPGKSNKYLSVPPTALLTRAFQLLVIPASMEIVTAKTRAYAQGCTGIFNGVMAIVGLIAGIFPSGSSLVTKLILIPCSR